MPRPPRSSSRRHGARHHLLGHRRGHAAPARTGCGIRANSSAAGRRGHCGPRWRRSWRGGAPAGLEGDDLLARLARAQDPETGAADVGEAADRQSRDLPRRRPRDHRQGADLDALSAGPRAAVAGAHPRRDRRRRRRGSRERGAPRAAAGHARGAEGGDAPLPAGARHDAPRRAGHDARAGDDQGRHAHRHSDLRGAPAQEAVGGPGPFRSRRASRPSARPSMRARSSCRSASGRAPASAARSP